MPSSGCCFYRFVFFVCSEMKMGVLEGGGMEGRCLRGGEKG